MGGGGKPGIVPTVLTRIVHCSYSKNLRVNVLFSISNISYNSNRRAAIQKHLIFRFLYMQLKKNLLPSLLMVEKSLAGLVKTLCKKTTKKEFSEAISELPSGGKVPREGFTTGEFK